MVSIFVFKCRRIRKKIIRTVRPTMTAMKEHVMLDPHVINIIWILIPRQISR